MTTANNATIARIAAPRAAAAFCRVPNPNIEVTCARIVIALVRNDYIGFTCNVLDNSLTTKSSMDSYAY